MPLVLFFVAFFISTVSAADVPVQSVSNAVNLTQSISRTKHSANMSIKGVGTTISIHHESVTPIDAYILYIQPDGSFDPLDSLTATLPAGKHISNLNIAASQQWKPAESVYRIYFLSSGETAPIISSIEMENTTFFGYFSIGLQQWFYHEPFTPSSYHRLRGYSLFGVSAQLIIGILSIILFLVMLRMYGFISALFVMILTMLIVNLHVSIDLLDHTRAQVQSWQSNKIYGAAGSTYEIADYLTSYDMPLRIRLCTNATSYVPTILRYALYPHLLTIENPDHLLVSQAVEWSYDGRILNCGQYQFAVKHLKTFSDDSQLYQLL